MKILVASILVCITCFKVNAQQTDSLHINENQFVWAAKLHAGTMLVHTPQVENIRGAKPRGLEIELSRMHTDKLHFQRWGFFSRNGVSLSYFDLNSTILGNSINAAYFVEPIFKLGNRAELRVKFSAGLSYLTNPYRSATNPNNKSYGSHLNFYEQVSVGTTYHLSKQVSAYLQGNFNHNSNGGLASPNRGINYPSLSAGIMVHSSSSKLPHYKREKDKSWKQKKPEWLVGIMTSPKEGWNGKKYLKQPLIGIIGEYTKQMSSVNSLLLGGEVYYDGGIALTKQNMVPADNTSNVFAGLYIGNQFLFNRLSFSQQIGVHLYKQTDNYNENYRKGDGNIGSVFQRFGLRYDISPKWKAGFSMLSRGRVADFIDIRVFYRIK